MRDEQSIPFLNDYLDFFHPEKFEGIYLNCMLKGVTCAKNNISYLVDDLPAMVNQGANKGIESYLIENKNVPHKIYNVEIDDRVTKIDNLYDLLKYH